MISTVPSPEYTIDLFDDLGINLHGPTVRETIMQVTPLIGETFRESAENLLGQYAGVSSDEVTRESVAVKKAVVDSTVRLIRGISRSYTSVAEDPIRIGAYRSVSPQSIEAFRPDPYSASVYGRFIANLEGRSQEHQPAITARTALVERRASLDILCSLIAGLLISREMMFQLGQLESIPFAQAELFVLLLGVDLFTGLGY